MGKVSRHTAGVCASGALSVYVYTVCVLWGCVTQAFSQSLAIRYLWLIPGSDVYWSRDTFIVILNRCYLQRHLTVIRAHHGSMNWTELHITVHSHTQNNIYRDYVNISIVINQVQEYHSKLISISTLDDLSMCFMDSELVTLNSFLMFSL